MTPRGLKRSVCGLLIVTSLTLIEVSTVRAEGVLGLSTTATNALGVDAGAGRAMSAIRRTTPGPARRSAEVLVSCRWLDRSDQQGEERSAAQQRNRQQREINRLKQQQAATQTDDRY